MSARGQARIAVVLATLAGLLALSGVSSAQPAKTPASYPSCGTYWNRNAPVTAARRVNACIVEASKEGRRARAVATLTTIEGDPIPNYVFVRGRRDVLVVVDSRRDAFGARTWQRLMCTRLVVTGGLLGWTGCRSVGTGKPAWLVPVRLSG
jgi:hypothetical protein